MGMALSFYLSLTVPMSIQPSTSNSVVQQFAREQEAAVYGRYKENGYQVNPLVSQAGGTLITGSLSAYEAFKSAGADFKVIKTLHTYPFKGEQRVAQDRCTIIREDTGEDIGAMGSSYTPVQNDALIHLFDCLRENVEIDNILTIRNGAKIFVSARCDIEGEVTSGDRIRRYLHAFNSFDGSSSFGVFFSDIRLQCANQINFLCGRGAHRAKAEETGMVMRHTASVSRFAAGLPYLINVEHQNFETDLNALRPLASLKLNQELAKRILETTYADELARPITDKNSGEKRPRQLTDLSHIDVIRSHYSGDTGYGIETGTAWGLFQAITQFETHDRGRNRGMSRSENEKARIRLEALYGGASAKRIDRARRSLLSLV